MASRAISRQIRPSQFKVLDPTAATRKKPQSTMAGMSQSFNKKDDTMIERDLERQRKQQSLSERAGCPKQSPRSQDPVSVFHSHSLASSDTHPHDNTQLPMLLTSSTPSSLSSSHSSKCASHTAPHSLKRKLQATEHIHIGKKSKKSKKKNRKKNPEMLNLLTLVMMTTYYYRDKYKVLIYWV